MERNVKLLASALRLAERAHAQYELKFAEQKELTVDEVPWPEFYAQWLFDNLHIWSAAAGGCVDGTCSVHDHADE